MELDKKNEYHRWVNPKQSTGRSLGDGIMHSDIYSIYVLIFMVRNFEMFLVVRFILGHGDVKLLPDPSNKSK